jgi:hypothetical protein
LIVGGGGGVIYSPGPVEVGEVGEIEDTVGIQVDVGESVAAKAGLNVRRRGEEQASLDNKAST